MSQSRWIVPTLGALFLTHAAMAQSFSFSEVKANISQGYQPAPTSITDSGDILLNVYTNGGAAAYFLHNQTLVPIAYQPYDTFNYANNVKTIVGVNLFGTAFIQNAAGQRTLLTGLNGDALNPTGINNKGVVALTDTVTGICYLYENGIFNSFQMANSQVGIFGVNDLDDVCGVVGTATSSYAFATRNGKVVEIDVPSTNGNPGVPYAINNSGQVAGNTTIDNPSIPVGLFANARGAVTIINGSSFGPPAMPGAKGPLMMAPASKNQTSVWGINNKGQIVGQSILIYWDGIHLRPFYYGFVGNPAGSASP